MKKNIKPWESHYKKSKSILIYPDENLVRLLKGFLDKKRKTDIRAIDIGCGTGRHMNLLDDFGVKSIIGVDNSINALSTVKKLYEFPVVQGENFRLPVKDKSFDIAVSWGSLHYCRKDSVHEQVKEIRRALKTRGMLFGTLRSDRDTYLKRGKQLPDGSWITNLKDLKEQIVSFYNEKELLSVLKEFNKIEYGIIERTMIGDMNKLLSHWIFRAEK